MGKARIGEPVATGSGNVAAVRLELDGDGDGSCCSARVPTAGPR
ncbi:hypothetical protein ACFWBC_07820 [Streptomyces sp. NPDC059985]